MIEFEVIRFKNILSYGNSFTEIPLNTHSTSLIVGENGAGKSTILEALSYVLYGKPFRRINKPQLLNSVNKKKLLVEIEFTSAKIKYLVRRGMKPGTFEIYQNGTLLNQTASVRDYQEYLEKNILKMNHKTFTQIVVLGSSTYVPFMQLSPSARREIIEDLLDLEIFSKMKMLLRDKLSTQKDAITETEFSIKLGQEKIDMHEAHVVQSLKKQKSSIAEKRALIEQYSSNIHSLAEDKDEKEAKLAALKQKYQEKKKLDAKRNQLLTIHNQLETRIKNLNQAIDFYTNNENCPTCEQKIEEEHKCVYIDKRNSKKAEIETAIEQLKKDFEEIKESEQEFIIIFNKIEDCNDEISSVNREIYSFNNLITNLNEEIEKLSDDLTTHTKKSQDELKQHKKNVVALKKERTELIEKYTVLKTANEILKDSGIKSKIIKQYIPIINKCINHYLQELGFFVQFNLDENFNETIKSRYRDDFSYESFSEGEKLRISLAILFSWRQISRMRNSISTNLLIMDEIFDSSLDSNGTEDFMRILNALTAGTNTFIISHNKLDTFMEKFSNVLKFEKIGNFSKRV